MLVTKAKSGLLVILIASSPTQAAPLAEKDLWGTWKLISAYSREVESGAVTDAYGPHPTAFITYGPDHRMMAMAEYGDRLKVGDRGKATAEQRAALFKTFWAYAGTYTFNGSTIEHHVDTSWNATWTGTTVIRDVAQDGNHIVLTTRPQVRFSDGKMNVITLTWEKVK